MTDLNSSNSLVILNLFRDNEPLPVILKQVQDDEMWDIFCSRGDAEARRFGANSLRNVRTVREHKIISRKGRRDTQSLSTYFLRASASPREPSNLPVRAQGAA